MMAADAPRVGSRRRDGDVHGARAGHEPAPTVAFLDWTHVIEDWLDGIGVSLEGLRSSLMGSWIFGYIEALRRVGVQVVWYSVSAGIEAPRRFTHEPSGATICLLPVPHSYRVARRTILNPYAESLEKAAGEVRGVRRVTLGALKEITPYLATPLRRLAHEISRDGCRAILCQDYEHPRFDLAVGLGRWLRVPVFASFQGGVMHSSRLERPLRPIALRGCAGLIIAAGTEVERVRAQYGVPLDKIARIFNPVDLDTWYPVDRAEARAATGLARHARIAVWHGRVDVQQKGLDVLLEAWERVVREHRGREVRLVLIGSDRDTEALRELIRSRRVPALTWIDEFVHDRAVLRRYLSAGDVYVFPSRHEGFPVAPIEAMACGLPVIATDAPGIPDILESGEAAGGLVIPRNDVDALAAALGRSLGDEAWCRELGRHARQRAKSAFSLDAIGTQLRSLLIPREPREAVNPGGCAGRVDRLPAGG